MEIWKISILTTLMLTLSSCNFIERLEEKARVVNNYEEKSLELAYENRLLQQEIVDLKYELEQAQSENKFLSLLIAG